MQTCYKCPMVYAQASRNQGRGMQLADRWRLSPAWGEIPTCDPLTCTHTSAQTRNYVSAIILYAGGGNPRSLAASLSGRQRA